MIGLDILQENYDSMFENDILLENHILDEAMLDINYSILDEGIGLKDNIKKMWDKMKNVLSSHEKTIQTSNNKISEFIDKYGKELEKCPSTEVTMARDPVNTVMDTLNTKFIYNDLETIYKKFYYVYVNIGSENEKYEKFKKLLNQDIEDLVDSMNNLENHIKKTKMTTHKEVSLDGKDLLKVLKDASSSEFKSFTKKLYAENEKLFSSIIHKIDSIEDLGIGEKEIKDFNVSKKKFITSLSKCIEFNNKVCLVSISVIDDYMITIRKAGMEMINKNR